MAASFFSRASHSAFFLRSISWDILSLPAASPSDHCRFPHQRRAYKMPRVIPAYNINFRASGCAISHAITSSSDFCQQPFRHRRDNHFGQGSDEKRHWSHHRNIEEYPSGEPVGPLLCDYDRPKQPDAADRGAPGYLAAERFNLEPLPGRPGKWNPSALGFVAVSLPFPQKGHKGAGQIPKPLSCHVNPRPSNS